MTETIFENKTVVLKRQDGIIYVIWQTVRIDIEAAREVVNQRLRATKGMNPYPILADITKVKNGTKEARKYLASNAGSEKVTAAALLTNSSLTAMLANFFMRLDKPVVPIKMFSDKDKAVKWLENYK